MNRSEARLVNLMGALSLAVSDRVRLALAEATELRGEGPAALLTVGTRPGRPIRDLRAALGLSHSGTVRVVDRLEERGWIRRLPGDGGREVLLELTEEGRAVFDRALEARRGVLREVLEPLPHGPGERLEQALERLLAALPEDRESAWNICRLCEHGVCRETSCPVGSAVDPTQAG